MLGTHIFFETDIRTKTLNHFGFLHKIGQSSVLTSEVSYCFANILTRICHTEGFEFETHLRMSPLKWNMSQLPKMLIAREIRHKSTWSQI